MAESILLIKEEDPQKSMHICIDLVDRMTMVVSMLMPRHQVSDFTDFRPTSSNTITII